MLRRGLACGLALALAHAAVVGAAPPADKNPYVARARVHLTALELELAAAALDEALATGDNDPRATAEIHGLAGVVAGARDRTADARDAFRRQLSLVPDAVADAELGPKILTPFDAARTGLAGRRLTVRVVAGAPGVIALVVDDDPAGLVAGARARVRTPGGLENVVAAAGTDRVELAVPTAAGTEVVVSALDARGNRLADVAWLAPTVAPLAVPASGRAATEEVAEGRPVYAHWALWGGIAGAATVTGVVFALLARSTRNELDDVLAHSGEHTLGEAEALDDEGASRTRFANVAFAVAGASAVAAGVLWLTRPTPGGVTVVGVPAGDGAAVGVAGRF